MTADEWNRTHAIGARVHVRGLKGQPDVETVTTTVAWHTSRGTPVVGVKARRGGVALADVTLIKTPAPVAWGLITDANGIFTGVVRIPAGGCRP